MKTSLKTKTPEELLQQLRQINVSVPGRTEGRRSEHCETWSICHFLASYAADPILQFPLELIARESPDFLLLIDDEAVGVEITEATHEDYSWASALAENDPHSILELSRFRPGHRIKRAKGIKPPVGSLDRPLQGPSWLGNEVERNWTEFMVETLGKKRTKCKSPSFERFPSDWLLIYDNTPTMALHLNEAASLLAMALKGKWADSFCKIFIETNKLFLHMTEEGWRTTPVNDLWDKDGIE